MLGVSEMIPRIVFLPCSVYTWDPSAAAGGGALSAGAGHATMKPVSYLCERQLDASRYRKWNNNAGAVDGINKVNAVTFEDLSATIKPFAQLTIAPGKMQALLGAITEEEEDEDDDHDDEDDGEIAAPAAPAAPAAATLAATEHDTDPRLDASDLVKRLEVRVLDDDVPQAFSHWTYSYTHRDYLVCDLQGELTAVEAPSSGHSSSLSRLRFEFTDPCIHSRRGERYGRTDKGEKGMRDFFHTHQCNAMCKLLGIANGSYRDW